MELFTRRSQKVQYRQNCVNNGANFKKLGIFLGRINFFLISNSERILANRKTPNSSVYLSSKYCILKKLAKKCRENSVKKCAYDFCIKPPNDSKGFYCSDCSYENISKKLRINCPKNYFKTNFKCITGIADCCASSTECFDHNHEKN